MIDKETMLMKKNRRGRFARLLGRWRWLQRVTRIHRVHHPRWSFGWTAPIGSLVYFEERIYKDDFRENRITIRKGHWERCQRDSYHDCTATGRF